MKIITCILMPAVLLATSVLYGQTAGNKAFDKYYIRKGITAPTDLRTKNVFYFTSTFPFSIGRIEKSDEWSLVPAFSIGNGGLFVVGRSEWNGTNARKLEPVFSFGIAADAGVKQLPGELKTTFNGNLMIGFRWVNLMLGYDFLDNTNYIGLALRFDLTSFSPNSIYVFSEKESARLK